MELERTVSEKGQIVIPKDIREHLGLKPGSEVTFDIEEGMVVMKPKKNGRAIVEEFCNVSKKKFVKLSVKGIKKLLEEQYEIP